VAFGSLMGLMSLDLGADYGMRIWLETVRDHPVPTFPMFSGISNNQGT